MADAMANVDHLSNLSNELLCKILSFLPSKEAYATMILSKRWEKVFLGVTTLEISDRNNLSGMFDALHITSRRRNFISCYLEILSSPFDTRQLEKTISLLISNNAIQYMCFQMSPRLYVMKKIIKCKTLVEVYLHKILIDSEVLANCLPNLTHMVLDEVTFHTKSVLLLFLNVSALLQDLELLMPSIVIDISSVIKPDGNLEILEVEVELNLPKLAKFSVQWKLFRLLASQFSKGLALENHLEEIMASEEYGSSQLTLIRGTSGSWAYSFHEE